MTDSVEVFQATAADYDRHRQRLIPPFDRFYGTAVEALDLGQKPPSRVLDLAAGTGLLAEQILNTHPNARLTLLDGSPAMLEQARARLGQQASYMTGELKDPLPPGKWDAIVSALAIHHLEDDDKRDLYLRIRQALSPGGMFVNAEQVAGPTPELEELYHHWHRQSARARGCEPGQWREAELRMRVDRCSDLESQVHWLREAGFTNVDCLFKEYRFAVLAAVVR